MTILVPSLRAIVNKILQIEIVSSASREIDSLYPTIARPTQENHYQMAQIVIRHNIHFICLNAIDILDAIHFYFLYERSYFSQLHCETLIIAKSWS